MAAFCGCCGAEITLKTPESCPLCGAPTHGMVQPDPFPSVGINQETSQITNLHVRRADQISESMQAREQ